MAKYGFEMPSGNTFLHYIILRYPTDGSSFRLIILRYKWVPSLNELLGHRSRYIFHKSTITSHAPAKNVRSKTSQLMPCMGLDHCFLPATIARPDEAVKF